MISLFVDQKPLEYTLSKAVLKILNKILEVNLVTQIKTPWVKSIAIHTMSQSQSSQSPCNSVFTGEVMVVIEVVDSLRMPQPKKIDVVDFGRPLEIIVRRPNILVLGPTSIQQRSSQLSIPAFDDEYPLVVTNTISPLPSRKINMFFFLLRFFLINRLIFIEISLFLMFFWWAIVNTIPSFILETSQLLIRDIIKFDSSLIPAPTLLIFGQNLINLVISQWCGYDLPFAFERVHVILPSSQQTTHTYDVVSQCCINFRVVNHPFLLDRR